MQRLWRGCFLLFLIEAALLIDLSQYLNHPKTFCFSRKYAFKNGNYANKRDWNLVIWVHHQEQFFLSMFKVVWRKNFRLPTIWQIFGIVSARKRENCMHIWENSWSRRDARIFFILTSTKKYSRTELKHASADETENVYLSFAAPAALLSWNGQFSVLLVKTRGDAVASRRSDAGSVM